MVTCNGNAVTQIYCGSKEIQRVYHGEKLVWPKYSGFWVFLKQLCNSLTDSISTYYGSLSNKTVSGFRYYKTGTSVYSRVYVARDKLVTGHKYYVSFTAEAEGDLGSNILAVYLGTNSGSFVRRIYNGSFGDGTEQHISAIGEFTDDRASQNQVYIQLNVAQYSYVNIRNLMVFDMTEMFGPGYEPTSAEEFERYYPKDFYNPDGGKWKPAPEGAETAYTKPGFD